VQKGNVNPFGLINDAEKKIASVIFDKNLEKFDFLGLHPMDNSATIELQRADFYTFLDSIGKKI